MTAFGWPPNCKRRSLAVHLFLRPFHQILSHRDSQHSSAQNICPASFQPVHSCMAGSLFSVCSNIQAPNHPSDGLPCPHSENIMQSAQEGSSKTFLWLKQTLSEIREFGENIKFCKVFDEHEQSYFRQSVCDHYLYHTVQFPHSLHWLESCDVCIFLQRSKEGARETAGCSISEIFQFQSRDFLNDSVPSH